MPVQSVVLGVATAIMRASSKVWVLGSALLATTAVAMAAPCTMGPLSGYLAAGFSCTVGDKTFSGFFYSPTTGMPTAANVTVTPEAPSTTNLGLLFTGAFSAVGQNADEVMDFSVAESPGSTATITDASVQVMGNTGVFSEVEVFSPTQSQPAFAQIGPVTDNLVHSLVFSAPLTTVFVTDDLFIQNGGSVTSFEKLFSQQDASPPPPPPVPEPSSLSALGAALLALLWARLYRA